MGLNQALDGLDPCGKDPLAAKGGRPEEGQRSDCGEYSSVPSSADERHADGSPEIYVYVRSSGVDARGSLVAYSANNRKSLSDIYLPPVTDNPQASKGYRGHDEYAVVEGIIAQRFPIYPEDASIEAPTGKMRQLQYKLVPGEATWQLKLDRTVEF